MQEAIDDRAEAEKERRFPLWPRPQHRVKGRLAFHLTLEQCPMAFFRSPVLSRLRYAKRFTVAVLRGADRAGRRLVLSRTSREMMLRVHASTRTTHPRLNRFLRNAASITKRSIV